MGRSHVQVWMGLWVGFILDKEKLPFFDIPDLTGCELKPYVEYNAPLISDELRNHQSNVNKLKLSKLGWSKLFKYPHSFVFKNTINMPSRISTLIVTHNGYI